MRQTRRLTVRRNTSNRFTRGHREIIHLAANIAGVPANELVQLCVNRGILKVGEQKAAQAQAHAWTGVAPLLAKLRHFSKETDRASTTPFGLKLYADTINALTKGSKAADVSMTKIIESSVEHEVLEVVKEILVTQFLTRDQETSEGFGKWAAHVSGQPPKARNGFVKLARKVIAARSSRSKNAIH
jgi:hypothetical protein